MGVLDAIGNTPIVSLDNLNTNPKVKIYAKLEGNNPGGSVKDRIAYYMIKDAEAAGTLTKDKVILEPTSGNTGIGLAMVAAAKGYKVKLVMPECVSMERRKTLEAFGAELILSPGKEGTDGAIRLAHKLYDENSKDYFMPDQFNNPSNMKAHYEGTGVEVYNQTKGEISVFMAGMGTSGTLMGTSKRLKEYDKSIQIVGVEPILGHKIQGLKNMNESIVPGLFDPSRLDEKINVNDDEAYSTSRDMAVKEGLFVGMSSGAAVFAALKKAKEMKDGILVVVLPDRGDRYLSTALFKSICADCPP
ncbi:PLP-dependent cysteine synthase family protein [Candidatus Magnetominusculus xianensis]|uniref:cysteine synthase n=1 Tax=Candidatus Magnetominusculus xianensis TaxID=1748249 RepID=A0ABR5SII5_9BACT|nr:cysteine synthase [Candidatus Magnetominusculus xianensis]KWT84062.1 cysteine synthase B [Candidatus Magnetominusculus xianensis]MBF0402355.1 cysteine synthase [Nitrospirota bacterium]